MSTIKTGIIGTGFIGPAHVEALRRLGNVEVVAVAERDDELAQTKAKELNIS
ncbi:MAG: Gfo/Idh/MocA family oxidoreductase, partial [Gammaproteobacteria bacterium]|nr:Gfo/Idh/MocA family oxidoreductase [Gammaproteobacteria bacterium]